MANCEQNNDFPKPDLANAIKPEKNMPERISQKDGLDYVAPRERNSKQYRLLGSFAQRGGKDEAEPELPHERTFKTTPQLGSVLDSETKISVTVDSSANRPNKSLDELEINKDYSNKKETDISQSQELTKKLDSNINMNFTPSIKIGDTVFINSTRQYKNSSLDITGERKSKEDYSIPDNNTHTKKNSNTTNIDNDNSRFIKTNSTIPTYGPEKNVKTSTEKTIDANTAFISPKEYDDLNIYSDIEIKREKEISLSDIDGKKQELEISDTKQTSKSLKEIDEPNKGEEKQELKIDDTDQTSKGLKEIDEPKDGDEKGLVYIEENDRLNKKNLQEIDEIDRQNKKDFNEIENNNQSSEKSLYDIGDIIPQGQKSLEEIVYNDNRISKPNINEVEINAGSSIDKDNVTVGESELSQKTNLLYNIKTPEHQTVENNYDVKKTLRNKDVADNTQADNSLSPMFNKNLSDDMEPIERKIKSSTDGITAESFSGFDSVTNEEIDAIIFDPQNKNYTENVFDKNFVSDNNSNSNFNYYENDFNSIKSNIDTNIEFDNTGKFITSTLRKEETEAVSSIGLVNPPDQENNRWDYKTIIENNIGEKVKASGEITDANSYSSIDTSSDGIIHQEIYPNDPVNIGSSAIQINNTTANIKNENYIYDEFSSPRNIDINYEQQNTEISTPRSIVEEAESVLNIDTAEQYGARADYTLFESDRSINDNITNQGISTLGIKKANMVIEPVSNLQSNINAIYYNDEIDKIIGIRTNIKLDSITGLHINWNSYSSEFAVYNNNIEDNIVDRLVVSSVKDILTAPVGQENYNFIYNIASFVNRAIPSNIIYGDNESTAGLETRQTLGGFSLKALYDLATVNTLDDTFWSEVSLDDNGEVILDTDGNQVTEIHSNYNGEARQLLDTAGNIIGYSYYNQESKNFNYEKIIGIRTNLKLDGTKEEIIEDKITIKYIDWDNYNSELAIYNDDTEDEISDRLVVTSTQNMSTLPVGQEHYNFTYSPSIKEGNIASKNSIVSNYSSTNAFLGTSEFGIHNYSLPANKSLLPSSSDYIAGETSSIGLSSSRDIETADDAFKPLWQMVQNIGSASSINNSINDVRGIINNVGQLFNDNFYKQFIGTSFSLNNDFGNIMRRFATVDIPVVAGSFLRSYNMMGGQDPFAQALGAVDSIKDLVSTTATLMNQPGAFLANLLRGESGSFETFTGGGSSMINIATQGTEGKFGGLGQAFFGNSNESNDINDSFAVRGSQWKTTPGQTMFNSATTENAQPYNKDFIVNEINVDRLNRKDLAKETHLTEYAAYKTFMSGYEGIRELANEDISIGEKRYPTKNEAWDINTFRTQTIRQKAATTKPITGGTITPYDLWKKNNVYAYLQQSEADDPSASTGFVPNPESLIHNKQSEGTFYDHIVVSSNGQGSLSGDAEWNLLTTDKEDKIWKQISSIPTKSLKYNSDIIFQAENKIKQEFHVLGEDGKLNDEQIRNIDPHDIEIRFNSMIKPENQVETKSIFLNINESNNYGGGKRAFIEKNRNNMLILLGYETPEPSQQTQQISRSNASSQPIG